MRWTIDPPPFILVTGFSNDQDGVLRHVPVASENDLENFGLAVARVKLGRAVVQPPRDSTR